MERIICLAIGYLFGMFQTSYIIGKIHHMDIRQYGSGNAGTTNALRTLGKKAGAMTLIGDMLKCVIAILIVDAVFENRYQEILPLLGMYTAAGCVLGHNFPFYTTIMPVAIITIILSHNIDKICPISISISSF